MAEQHRWTFAVGAGIATLASLFIWYELRENRKQNERQNHEFTKMKERHAEMKERHHEDYLRPVLKLEYLLTPPKGVILRNTGSATVEYDLKYYSQGNEVTVNDALNVWENVTNGRDCNITEYFNDRNSNIIEPGGIHRLVATKGVDCKLVWAEFLKTNGVEVTWCIPKPSQNPLVLGKVRRS